MYFTRFQGVHIKNCTYIKPFKNLVHPIILCKGYTPGLVAFACLVTESWHIFSPNKSDEPNTMKMCFHEGYCDMNFIFQPGAARKIQNDPVDQHVWLNSRFQLNSTYKSTHQIGNDNEEQ